ncbi:tetratricopeptide repeat protein [Jutongia hominis]|uniref:Tetratricopeptide repeat protein n=1 Tax=Jutongia hominis TaxID=2763664 RepID=A0ABR7MR20_9FIRM|nr:tetratricopeptide repeat protein [Jutongia hominis]MBC8556240.1 tetratricopeptide repeat protein [Jutongia hominis]
MGKLIQCSSPLALTPYHFRLTDTNVYSMEEVCYYIWHNIYMIQEEVFDREFVMWIEKELHMEETSHKLACLIQDHKNLRDIVVTICCSCDYYDEEEINALIRLMDEIEQMPAYARKKHKGDTYLACHSYEKALEEYEKVFESDEVLHAEKEAYGSIFHNMGVAYSNLAEFRKAAEYFLKAYEQNKKDASLSQGLFALRLSKDVEGYKKALVDFDVSPEKQLQWEKEYTQVISQSSQCREALKIEKLRNVMKSGNVAEYYDKVHKYVLDWKNEYRKQIV